MRQQVLNLTGLLRRQPRQYIVEVRVRIMLAHACRLDQAHDRLTVMMCHPAAM